jgi:hypothetical protein
MEGNALNTLLRVSSLLRFERDSWASKGWGGEDVSVLILGTEKLEKS